MISEAYNKNITEWTKFPNTDIVWVDPPWGKGFVKFFNTMMKKQTGKSSNHTILDILKQIGKLSSNSKPLIVEYSIKEASSVKKIMEKYGHTHSRTIKGIYADKLPFAILVFNCNVDLGKDGERDEFYVRKLRQAGYKSAFDPCAGIGHTAKIFHRQGFVYIGSEINRNRYLRLSDIIEKHNNKNVRS